MNNIEPKKGCLYEVDFGNHFTDTIWVKEVCKIRVWFRVVDGIVWSNFNYTEGFNKKMTVKKFKKIALRKLFSKDALEPAVDIKEIQTRNYGERFGK